MKPVRALDPQAAGSAKPRLLSLDVLRGLDVAFMILVNTAGDGRVSYPQLRHSVWNGFTLTDLVFPLFLFIMGVSMALSFQSRLARGASKGEIAMQVVRRSLTIVLIGLLLNALPAFHLDTLRYCGVLQRIGICYLVAGFVLLFLRVPGAAIAAVVSIGGYWLLMTRVPVPGFGHPGINMPVLDPMGNLASYLDRLILPAAHRYHQTFYDPEGLLSTIPAIGTTLLGVLTSAWLRGKRFTQGHKLAAMAGAAAVLIAASLLWAHSFPLNKRLWTSSYVLFAGGISIGLLALFAWVLDHRQWLRPAAKPFVIFGTNALTAYIFSEVLAILIDTIAVRGSSTLQRFTYLLLPAWLGPAPFRSLVWSLLYVGVCFLPVLLLYRRGIVVKL
jgi:predicted acyltransferase